MLYGKVGYHDWEGVSVDKDERFRIAKNLGENKVLIMRNHGLLTVGETAGESFMNMYYAIRMCEIAASSSRFRFKIRNSCEIFMGKNCKNIRCFFSRTK